jgi:DNA-directed RNA polymerase specialized sigma24 family protein
MARAVGYGGVDPAGAPGYLTVIARNRATDIQRAITRVHARATRASTMSRRHLDSAEDSSVADAVDAYGSRQEVAAALSLADDTTRRVITAFLDLAQLEHDRPNAADVARAAGVSRKTVFAALSRLRAILVALGDPG